MPEKPRFAELLESYEKEIYRYTFRMAGNHEDASDLLQETFLRAFRAFPRLPRGANYRAWLYRIAHRQALNLFRSKRVRAAVALDDGDARGVSDRGTEPDSLEETRRLVGALARVIRELTPRQRSALLLRKYEGLPYGEVAAILSCTEENARAHVYQAMKKVRNGLKPKGGGS